MKICILICLILQTSFSFTQDRIVKRNGDEIICKILEISPDSIKYVIDTITQTPKYSVPVNVVFMTEFQNGLKQVYSSSRENIKADDTQGAKPQTEKEDVLIDPRDGNQYMVIKIGNQWWMVDNLKYKTSRSFSYQKRKKFSEDCRQYYNFFEAIEACPDGWHLPTDAEWMEVESNVGMNPAEAGKSGWRGTPPGQAPSLLMGGRSGLNLRMCGRMNKNGKGDALHEHAYYWTSTSMNKHTAWIRHFQNRLSIERMNFNKFRDHLPIRCVKDRK